MKINEIPFQTQVNVVRDFVAFGAKATIEKYNLSYDEITRIALQVRRQIKKDWCLKNKALPSDFDLLICIAKWCPSDKKLKREFLSYFKGCKKDYKKLLDTVDTSVYKMPASIPLTFRVCVVEGLKKSNFTTDMINVLSISRKTLRKWQSEV